MPDARPIAFDEIGYWSEIKLDILREYASAYSRILNAQPGLTHVYIDAFAGGGVHLSRTTGQFVLGSPLNALAVEPPFHRYYLIDLSGEKVASLRSAVGDRNDVEIHQGDCNRILLETVFPNVLYEQYRRGLCVLDPYGLHLEWNVMETAGKMRSLDVFLNFPIMDMNRNVLWRHPERVDAEGLKRMNAFWGDESWRSSAYQTIQTLFGEDEEKTSNRDLAEGFRQRLKDVARFSFVPEAMPMYNSKGAVVYYLFFASQKPVADRIVTVIFRKYGSRGHFGA